MKININLKELKKLKKNKNQEQKNNFKTEKNLM